MVRRVFMAWGALAVLGTTAGVGQDTLRVGVALESTSQIFTDVRIPVWVDMRQVAGERLGAFTLRLTWANTVLFYRQVIPRSVNNVQVRTDSTAFGIAYVTGINVAGVDSIRTLFDLVLDHGSGSASTSPIDVQPTVMSGIQPAFRDLLTTTTVVTEGGQYCAQTGRWGDLDGDGFANSRDGLAVLTSVVGLPTTGFDLTKADVDNDGNGNTRDALILLSYAVGLEIPGHRVLLPIAGSCLQGTTPRLTLDPDTVELVPRQEVSVLINTTDAVGTVLAGALNWRSLDPTIAVVDTAGLITGIAPGTVGVIGSLGPGLKDTVLVTVLPRRGVWHVSSQTAAGAGIQLGTARYPFDDVFMTMSWVSEGDTVLLGPGVNLIDFNPDRTQTSFDVGVVLMGDTTGGKPRPVIRAPSACCNSVRWRGGGRTEIRSVEFDGLYWAIEVDFLKRLVIDDVTVRKAVGTRYGLIVNRFVDTVQVFNSRFFGDTTTFNSIDGIYLRGSRLVEMRDVILDGWRSVGIEIFDADSTDIQRATVTGPGFGLLGFVSVKPDFVYRLTDSHIDTDNDPVFMNGVRTMISERNVYRARSAAAASRVPLEVDGRFAAGTTPRVFRSVNDTIDYVGNSYWSYFSRLDSLSIDGLFFQHGVDSLTFVDQYMDASYAQITNSQLLGLNLDGITHRGRRLTVDNTTFAGCTTACTWNNAIGVESQALTDSGPYLTVTNSSFFNLQYAVYSPTFSDSAGPSIIVNNTMDSVQFGINLDADSLFIADNVITRVGTRGMDLDRSGTNKPTEFASVLRNRIQCNPNIVASYGILFTDTPGRLENNKVVDCYYGIYASMSTSTAAGWKQEVLDLVGDTIEQSGNNIYGLYLTGRWLPSLYNNTIRNSPQYGMYLSNNILPGDVVTMIVDSNAISGTGLAAIRYQVSDSLDFLGHGNRLDNNLTDGLFIATSIASNRVFRDGQFDGNGRWAINSPYPVDAQFNYWGDPGGAGGAFGNQGTLGDSVSSANVNVSNFLTSAPAGLPPLAPPPPVHLVAADRTSVTAVMPVEPSDVTDVFTRQGMRAAQQESIRREHERRRTELREARDLERAAAERDAAARREAGRRQLDERLFRR